MLQVRPLPSSVNRLITSSCTTLNIRGLSSLRQAKLKVKPLSTFVSRLTTSSRTTLNIRGLSSLHQAKNEPLFEDSDLHKINAPSKNPIEIFSKWYNEHMANNVSVTSAKAFSLATVSKNGKVSCRSLILRRLDEDGFVMMTDGRSRKSNDLAENPQASMLFLWLGKTADNLPQTRQVRIEGTVNKLSTDNMKELYDIEPLFCKIRAQVCEQGKVIEWNQLKRDHDELYQKVINNNIQLPKPDHVVAYKLVPNVIEFYEATGQKIADRLLFTKDGVSWEPKRLAA